MLVLRNVQLSLAAAALVCTGMAVAFVPSPSFAMEEVASDTIEGSWEGDFGAGTWVFRFTKASGEWSGTYRHQKFDGWNPLQNLSASGTSAKFSIDADVVVDFDLDLANANSLNGTVRFGPSESPPQQALVLPVKLVRTAL